MNAPPLLIKMGHLFSLNPIRTACLLSFAVSRLPKPGIADTRLADSSRCGEDTPPTNGGEQSGSCSLLVDEVARTTGIGGIGLPVRKAPTVKVAG